MLYHISSKKNPFAAISKITASSDIFIANLEIPLTNAKTATTRKTPEQVKAKTQFILKADPAHIKYLVKAGVNAVSLGTNHTMDYRIDGLKEELALLKREGIAYSGAGLTSQYAALPGFFQDGKSPDMAIVSYLTFLGEKHRWMNTPATAKSAGVAVLPFGGAIDKKVRAKLVDIVDNAKQSVNFVVVALHGGIERQTVPTSYQVNLARAFIDAGADVVVGHHPHVLQGAEIYKGKPIFYSTGNLINSLPGNTALFHLKYNGRKLVKVALTPCTIAKGAVVPMKAKQAKIALKAFDNLSRLVKKKFPNKHSSLLLSAYGS